jgi:predicted nucleotidyltransferase
MAGLEVIDARYRALYERAVEVLGADPRVAAVELSGSVASGTADRWSDLDLAIVAHADQHASLLTDWPTWLAEITPTVFARTPIAPFIINAVTAEGLTLDVAVWPDAVPNLAHPTTYTVGMLSGVRFDDIGAALEYAVVEQLRGMAGPFISLVQREEHMRHLGGVPHLLGLLSTVFLAETGGAPPGKHWNLAFTEEQRGAVASLPAVRATRVDIVAFGLGVAEMLVRRARPLYERYELAWPAALAKVVAARVRTELGIETSSWLF